MLHLIIDKGCVRGYHFEALEGGSGPGEPGVYHWRANLPALSAVCSIPDLATFAAGNDRLNAAGCVQTWATTKKVYVRDMYWNGI